MVDVQAQDKSTLSHTLSLTHTLTLSLSRTHTLSNTLSLAGRVEGLVGTTAAEVLVVVDVQARDRHTLSHTLALTHTLSLSHILSLTLSPKHTLSAK